MSQASVPLDQLDVITARLYGEHGYPHDAWTRMRRDDPVHWCEPAQYKPFWAITKHADIVEISTQPDRFRSAGRFILFPEAPGSTTQEFIENPPLRMLVNMDPPEHRDYRKLVSHWFTPRAIKKLEPRLEEITRHLFDELAAKHGGVYEGDFVRDVAARQPLRMITEMLGIPREMEDFVLRVTNENFGIEDPEFQREGDTREDRLAFLQEAFAFLAEVTEDRRKHPKDDLSTVLAQATFNGQPVPQFELFSLYFLIMVAGHDTTRNAISGGLVAFLDNPDELVKLRRDPGLAVPASEEIVRWTTPVNHFSRTAALDYRLRDKTINAGDSVALFYASANRDEEIYADPFAFHIDRDPNPHLGFGIGEHYCLGAHLARLDLQVFFRQLVERVEALETTGPIARLHASFVGGPKRIPLRMKLRPAP